MKAIRILEWIPIVGFIWITFLAFSDYDIDSVIDAGENKTWLVINSVWLGLTLLPSIFLIIWLLI